MNVAGNRSSQSIGALLENLDELCQSESISEKGLREIIGLHGYAPNNDPSIFDYLFFHEACWNEKVTERILRYLIKNFPRASRSRSIIEDTRVTPLHCICLNKNVTLGMVQLLVYASPNSLRHENNNGYMPLHALCGNRHLDEVGMEILKLLLEKCPESVRHADSLGDLPIHYAASRQSPEFCRILIEAYPGSERIAVTDSDILPFHFACTNNIVATAKYLYQLYPESIYLAADDAAYPIHVAIMGLKDREHNHESAIQMVQFLLDCEPNVALQELDGKLPLYFACKEATNENTPTMLNAYLKIMQILYDAHPESIEDNEFISIVGSFPEEVQTFISTQLTYARQARDLRQMNTPGENGQLPLHRALHDNPTITLGSIKLLVKGNPSAITSADNSGMIPLHVACQHHETPAVVVEYLIGLSKVTLTTVDGEGNTALHYTCRGANHAIIALLLDKYGSMSVAKRNAHNQLPIELLLLNKNEVSDEESVKFTESIYRLLRANPETLVHYNLGQASSEDCISQQNKKKRKIDEV
jgi:ankyrin repeat protein